MREKLSIPAGAVRFLSSRLFGAAMLAVASAVLTLILVFQTQLVSVTDGTSSHFIVTMNTDTDQILSQAGIYLSPDDQISISNSGDTFRNITILRAGDLKNSDATLSLDESNAGVINVSYYGMLAQYGSETEETVEYQTIETSEAIPYETSERATTLLRVGRTKVLREGADGKKVTQYQQKLVNGQVVETTLLGTNITQEPVTKQVLVGAESMQPYSEYGTGGIELDANGFPVSYRQLITGKGTCYNGPTMTCSTGRRAMPGHVAVDPREIPYGSRLYITSADGSYVYGYAIAADTGGFIYTTNVLIDLFITDYDECALFGLRDVRVYVL
ncbi:MAG: hypothetical protein HFE85_04305 [Clostridiales bacterium]|nr:hypothetical protein [Clostridiales bacterium]